VRAVEGGKEEDSQQTTAGGGRKAPPPSKLATPLPRAFPLTARERPDTATTGAAERVTAVACMVGLGGGVEGGKGKEGKKGGCESKGGGAFLFFLALFGQGLSTAPRQRATPHWRLQGICPRPR